MRATIVLAPSSAGKSFYVSEHPDIAVDGDEIIRDTIGWPKQPRWWEDLALRARVDRANAEQLLLYSEQHQEGPLIFFNGSPDSIGRVNVLAVVVPPRADLKRNAEAKRQEQLKGRKRGQPTDLETLEPNWRRMAKWAAETQTPLLSTFDAAVDLHRKTVAWKRIVHEDQR